MRQKWHVPKHLYWQQNWYALLKENEKVSLLFSHNKFAISYKTGTGNKTDLHFTSKRMKNCLVSSVEEKKLALATKLIRTLPQREWKIVSSLQLKKKTGTGNKTDTHSSVRKIVSPLRWQQNWHELAPSKWRWKIAFLFFPLQKWNTVALVFSALPFNDKIIGTCSEIFNSHFLYLGDFDT